MNSNLTHNFIERLSQLVLDNASDAIISTDEHFRIRSWNKAAEKIYGLSEHQLKGKIATEIFHYEFLTDSSESFWEKLVADGRWSGIIAFNRPDGIKVFLNASFTTIRNENNELIGHVEVNRDVTDAYLSKEIQKNEQRLSLALQGAGDGVWEYNFQTDESYYSSGYKKMLGFADHEFTNDADAWRSRIHPEDLPRVMDIEEKYDRGEIENHAVEYRIKHRSGKYIWTLDRGMIVEKTKEGKLVRLIGTQMDIGHQKKAEEKIKSFLESAPDAMIISNDKGIIEIINSQAERLFGYERQELLGKTIDFLLPERYANSHSLYWEGFYRNPKTGELGRGFELFAKRKDGKEIPVEISLSPIRSEEGVMLSAAIRDITERKKAEQQLKESEEKFNKAFHLSPTGMTLTSQVTGKWIDVNESFSKMTGYKKEELIGHSSAELEITSPNNRKQVWEELVEKGYIREREDFFRKKNGETGVALSSVERIIINNEPCFISIIYDITERKKTEQKLVEANERYDYVSRATSDAIWDWDIASDTIYRGEGYKTIFGYKETISSLELRMSSIIHPDDKERVRVELENALNGNALHWHSEYRFKCADGTYKQVIDKAYIIRNEIGEAVRMIGAVQDVTEQRSLQAQLVKEEERKKKEVLEAIIHAQERERHEISHELHDNVSQILTTCKLLLDAAVEQNDNKYLQQTKENLQKAIDEMRNISHRLNPATLKFIGLEGSVHDLANNINHSGRIRINFLSSLTKVEKINDDIQLALFRIIQEQLNNILKHAGAKKVMISLSNEDGKINLTITDDGKGYDLKVKKHGLGLKNIFNRAEFHKGTAQIFSEPGKGFKLQVQIPY